MMDLFIPLIPIVELVHRLFSLLAKIRTTYFNKEMVSALFKKVK